ncbi:Uncharacterised protein [Mycobacteroides abscessus subsp. abscessus]|nr:Uncharacterised protein [Mycobacteroides abscessus subsp. abscessus]
MTTETSLLNASSKASETTAKKTTNPTTVPTIEMMMAAILVPLVLPDWQTPTMPRTNAIGNRTQPTIRAPGIQAKTKPTTAATTAMSPSVFLCLDGAAGGRG